MGGQYGRVTAVAVTAVLALAACNHDSSAVADGGKAATAQSIVRNNAAEPESLDPHKITGIPEIHILRDLLEGLVQTDAQGRVMPAVAQRWESADNTVWIFHLRDNARWSNGDPVTAADFVYSWRRLADPHTASPYASYLQSARVANIDAILAGKQAADTLGITALDAHTLQITLSQPVPYFPSMLFHAATKPVHRATVAQYGEQWTRPEHYVGNGAFSLKEWQVNDHITLARNPQYWDNAHNQLDEVVYVPIASETANVARFEAGELAISDSALPPEQFAALQQKYGSQLKVSPYLCTYYLELNNQQAPFNDARVRRALSLVLDRSLIAEKVVGRGETVQYNFTRIGTNGFVPYQAEWHRWPQQQRVAEAKKLLAEAGYSAQKPLRFTYLYNTAESHKKIALAAASLWQETLGAVEVTLENQEWKSYLEARRNGHYQLARASWCGDYNEPSTFLNTLRSDNSSNRARYRSPEYDAILQRSLAAGVDDAERSRIYQQAEAQIDADTPIIPLYGFVNSRLVKPWVAGYSTEDAMNELYSKNLSVLPH